jgi:molecular chaperone GrpE
MEKDDEDVTPGEAEERAAPEAPAANGGGDMSQQLAEEREKAEQYYRNWQRSAADFVNYKRRVEQERGELARFANAAMVINILPVFDDLERAVETVDAHMAGLNWVQGVVAIHRKFANLLEAMGVAEIPAAGETFDPAIHEAVARQPGAENTVLHVVQKGYRLGEKVVRPAMVIVGEGEKE